MSKSPSLRRIQADLRELSIDPSPDYHAAPLEHDMFEWHFTIRGASGTDFEGGIYHGRILLPAEYPFKPPNIIFLTPSGRFETNTKVCLSFSAYHPELWQPAWGIRLILEALISFLPTRGDGAIGALDWTPAERRRLAKKSVNWKCSQCGLTNGEIMKVLDDRIAASKKSKKAGDANDAAANRFQKEIEQLHALQLAAEGPKKDDQNEEGGESKEKPDEKQQIDSAETKKQDSPTKETKPSSENTVIPTIHSNNNQEKETFQQHKQNKDIMHEEITDHPDTIVSDDVTSKTVETPDRTKPKASTDSESDGSPDTLVEVKKDDDEKDESQTDEQEILIQNSATNDDADNDNVDITSAPIMDGDNNVDIEFENDHNNGNNNPPLLDSPIFSDPVIHIAIVLFSMLVLLLVRKIRGILEDLAALEAQFQAT